MTMTMMTAVTIYDAKDHCDDHCDDDNDDYELKAISLECMNMTMVSMTIDNSKDGGSVREMLPGRMGHKIK